MRFLLLLLAVGLATPVWAQKAVVNSATGERLIMTESFTGTEFQSIDEYFGSDAETMWDVIEIAAGNSVEDRFRWEAKIPDLISGVQNNSCQAAAINLIESVNDQGVLPDGWTIKNVGTLGSLTNVENTIFGNWYRSDAERDLFGESSVLDPPSYAHSLTVVQSPDGNYYTVDNWSGGAKVSQVYPIDADGVFFSSNPNETDIQNADYRLQRNRYGTDDLNESDPDEKSKGEPPPTSEPVEVEVLTSADPNDKLGLAGVGEERFITPDARLDYVIRFENMPEASAPAQEVLIRDTLDATVLDLTTFSLGDIRFSGRTVSVPPGLRSFSQRVPFDEAGRFVVLIDATLVLETGIATWRFTTLDVSTGDLPFDPLDGFLPPNQTSPEGEGSVSFNVQAREGLASGTRIRNQARIFFDLNEPIDTPPWSNTLDHAAPLSRVADLAAVQADSVFTVSWSGEDAEAGVRTFDVYAAVNDGPFFRWLKRTPAREEVFVGAPDSTYAFYSIAYDAVGNAEPGKTEPDATTGVAVSDERVSSLPEALTLAAPFPNPAPASGPVALHLGLPASGPADVRVYDVQGREVAVLADGDRPAGWHTVRWDPRDVASGVYVLRLRSDGEMRTRTLTVVR
ncbi:MAG: T9SS type A sorting domain-containing protein [Bacteroidota bacterium]